MSSALSTVPTPKGLLTPQKNLQVLRSNWDNWKVPTVQVRGCCEHGWKQPTAACRRLWTIEPFRLHPLVTMSEVFLAQAEGPFGD